MSTDPFDHSSDDSGVYRDCVAHTHAAAARYDNGQTFTHEVWAAVAVDDTADQYTDD